VLRRKALTNRAYGGILYKSFKERPIGRFLLPVRSLHRRAWSVFILVAARRCQHPLGQ
jgi:hypothetical protein